MQQIFKSLLTPEEEAKLLKTLGNSLKHHQKKLRSLQMQKKHILITMQKLDDNIIKQHDIVSRADQAIEIIKESQKEE